jgi:hypothetical protein
MENPTAIIDNRDNSCGYGVGGLGGLGGLDDLSGVGVGVGG